MARQTMTVSLPDAMVKEFERVRKAENRTRSELVREALRQYFYSRFPVVEATPAELAAIRRARAEIRKGRSVSLDQLLHEMARRSRGSGAKSTRKSSR